VLNCLRYFLLSSLLESDEASRPRAPATIGMVLFNTLASHAPAG